MRYLTTDEIKQAELEMLIVFDGFCGKHGLSYSLAGGTMLGAVRHKGFIPWDDDIDLSMGRPDFDRLIELRDVFEAETGLRLAGQCCENIAECIFFKVENPKIQLEYRHHVGANNLWLDIIPIDGCSENDDEARAVFAEMELLRRKYMVSECDPRDAKTPMKRLAKWPAKWLYSFPPLKRKLTRRMLYLTKRIPYDQAAYVACIGWGLYGLGERMPKEGFEKKVTLEFEGHQFQALSCWDSYLKGIYKNYWELPPEEDRVTHEMKAWRVEEERSQQ